MLRISGWLNKRFPGQQAQWNIRGDLLPSPIHEFIAEVRERFAAELQEYQITIREWEH